MIGSAGLRRIGGWVLLAAVASTASACGAFDSRTCAEIQDEQYRAIAATWPEAAPEGDYSHGACDDSGDPAMAVSDSFHDDERADEIDAELAADGWTRAEETYGAVSRWLREEQGLDLEATIQPDRTGMYLVIAVN